MVISWGGGSDVAHGSCWPWLSGWFARVQLTLHARVCTVAGGLHCQWYAVEHSNSGKKSFDSIRQSDKFAACTLIFK